MSRSVTPVDLESFSLGWQRTPGSHAEAVGSVRLPARPDTLGEARGGLEMLAGDEATSRWLTAWASAESEERTLLLELPSGWYQLTNATIAEVPGAVGRCIVRFDRRSSVKGPV